jgi:AraC-like DNA-binding protein
LPLIAKQLGLAQRSSQRRFDEQRISFEQILDDVRRRRAEELLPLNDLPMIRIAQSLGYSSQTSFTRACRRWFGTTPQAQRKRNLSVAS